MILFFIFIIVSALLSFLIVRRTNDDVQKGFRFGPPASQITVTSDGTYTVNYYGYPSTYRIQETFKPSGDVFNESTYELFPLSKFYLFSNFIFWLALFMALLAPLTIFYRPKKNATEHKNVEDFGVEEGAPETPTNDKPQDSTKPPRA